MTTDTATTPTTTAQAAQAARPAVTRPIKPKPKTRRVHATLSEEVYKLLMEKFPGYSDGQAAAQAIEACLGIERSANAFQGYKHFTCIHRAHGYAVPGLNRAQVSKIISVVSKSSLTGMSKTEKAKLKRGIDRTTLQKKMKAAAEAGKEFEFNGWLVLDDREGGK